MSTALFSGLWEGEAVRDWPWKNGWERQLKIGAKREDVVGFFEQHGVPFVKYENTVEGGFTTTACSPFGCGADRVMLGVRVKLDAAGAMSEEPRVFGMYLDCL